GRYDGSVGSVCTRKLPDHARADRERFLVGAAGPTQQFPGITRSYAVEYEDSRPVVPRLLLEIRRQQKLIQRSAGGIFAGRQFLRDGAPDEVVDLVLVGDRPFRKPCTVSQVGEQQRAIFPCLDLEPAPPGQVVCGERLTTAAGLRVHQAVEQELTIRPAFSD